MEKEAGMGISVVEVCEKLKDTLVSEETDSYVGYLE